MRRAVFALLVLLVPAVPAPASPSGPERAPTVSRSSRILRRDRPALNPMAGVVEAARFVEASNVAALHAAAALIGMRTLLDVAAMVKADAASGQRGGTLPTVSATYTGDLSGVVTCIKGAESGNYSESSHPQDGSGAYQFIPRTWRYYFGLWQAGWNADPAHKKTQVPYYDLAYQAPPWVQDATLHYALTHGGAGNWSMRYGQDNCTAGLPGGG